jgi:kynurenine formamidase
VPQHALEVVVRLDGNLSVHAVTGDALQVAKATSTAAKQGAEATKSMLGRAGRSGYANAANLKDIPDPGAHAVSVWMCALAQQLEAEERVTSE